MVERAPEAGGKWKNPFSKHENGSVYIENAPLRVHTLLSELKEKFGVLPHISVPTVMQDKTGSVVNDEQDFFTLLNEAEALVADDNFWQQLPEEIFLTQEAIDRLTERARSSMAFLHKVTQDSGAKEVIEVAGTADVRTLHGPERTGAFVKMDGGFAQYLANKSGNKNKIRKEIQDNLERCHA